MKSKKIAVVEDNLETQKIIRRYLEREGFEVFLADRGEDGLDLVREQKPDLLILDVNLPEMDGFEMLRRLQGGPYLPVIIVTARHDDTDKIIGLEMGADDYLTKPFNPRELLARVRAVLRRVEASAHREKPEEKEKVVIGDIELDWSRQKLRVGDESHALTVTECLLLKYLMHNTGRVLSREQILDEVWGKEFVADVRIVDVHISNLRKRFASREKQYIHAVRGAGYRFET